MMHVRIFKPAKTAMQSGRGKAKDWVLEYERLSPERPEPLMGWSSAADTYNQVRLRFPTREAAVEFAEKQGWTYDIQGAHQKRIRPRNYGDNFRFLPAK